MPAVDAPWKIAHIRDAEGAQQWGVPTFVNMRAYEVLLDEDGAWVARVRWIDDNVWHEAYLPEGLLVYEDVLEEWYRQREQERGAARRRAGELRERWDELRTHRPVRWQDVPAELAVEAYERFEIENQCHAAVANTHFYTFSRCSRSAVDGSPYCTVHLRIARGETTVSTKRARRSMIRRDARKQPDTPESFWWYERFRGREEAAR